MGRNASSIEVLKFGIVYRGMQNRHLPLVVLNQYVALIRLLFEFYSYLTYFINAIFNNCKYTFVIFYLLI